MNSTRKCTNILQKHGGSDRGSGRSRTTMEWMEKAGESGVEKGMSLGQSQRIKTAG